MQYEPEGKLLGQRGDGEFLRHVEEGVDPSETVRLESRGPVEYLRIHRGVLQPGASTFHAGLPKPRTV